MRTLNSSSAALTVNPGSTLFKLAVEQYVRHSPQAFADRCSACRARFCPVQAHATEVIRAAGIDPATYDPPPRRPAAMHWSQERTKSLPVLAVRRSG
jgi:hypothetical protein